MTHSSQHPLGVLPIPPAPEKAPHHINYRTAWEYLTCTLENQLAEAEHRMANPHPNTFNAQNEHQKRDFLSGVVLDMTYAEIQGLETE